MKGFKDSQKKFHPITEYKKGTRKSRDQNEKTQGVLRLKRKARGNLTDKDKKILRDWVKQNKNWTTIDDLPNEIFIPLVSPAGDDTDKRVEIQVEAIKYMKSVTPKSTRKARDENGNKQKIHARDVMNKKLDKAGVGKWYNQLHVRDRATIFEIFQSRTGTETGDFRFDLYGFPLKFADDFVKAVVDWRSAKQNLSRQHEQQQIASKIIKQRRAEEFKGVSFDKLREMRRELSKDEKHNKKKIDAITEEMHQRTSGLTTIKQRLQPRFPARGSPEITPQSTLEML